MRLDHLLSKELSLDKWSIDLGFYIFHPLVQVVNLLIFGSGKNLVAKCFMHVVGS